MFFSQQNVVLSTIWRYVYNNRYETYKGSMYGGMLIDTYEQFFWKFAHAPDQLYASVLGRDYVSIKISLQIVFEILSKVYWTFEEEYE